MITGHKYNDPITDTECIEFHDRWRGGNQGEGGGRQRRSARVGVGPLTRRLALRARGPGIRFAGGAAALASLGRRGHIRNGFMPHIMGHKYSHIYARELR
jgi:hypothetical protein